jgi:hypothetical protein
LRELEQVEQSTNFKFYVRIMWDRKGPAEYLLELFFVRLVLECVAAPQKLIYAATKLGFRLLYTPRNYRKFE